MTVSIALVHEFNSSGPVILDEDGDAMLGWYYQFADDEDKAVTGLIGPYSKRAEAQLAAERAFSKKDF